MTTDITSPFSAVPEEERMRRIGVFVCRIARLETQPTSPPSDLLPVVLADDTNPSRRVLAFLGRVREASPVEIRVSLGLSRSMAYRTLQRLVLTGQVGSSGNTRTVVYRAASEDPSRN